MTPPGRAAAPAGGDAGFADAAGGPGWVAHLRAGGTTPWLAWRERTGPAGPLPRGALPGAQQLELLRRLNVAGRPSRRLADRVLAAGGTGRGRLDLELVGDAPARPYGAPPVDPAALPAADLLRIAVGLVADGLVAGQPSPAGAGAGWAPAVPPTRRRRPWRRRYRVVGDPRLAAHARVEAARRGRALGGRPGRVLVLGAGLEQALADVWCARALGPGAPPWDAWLRGWAERDATPPRADVAALAQEWARRRGARRVRVLLDPRALPRALGTTPLLGSRAQPPPPPPGAGAAELARRVGAVLGVLVEPPERRRLVGQVLLPRLAALRVPGADHPIAVPPGVEPWLGSRARVVRDAVAAGGYRVHGDPDALLERTRGGPPGPASALAVAVAALLAAEGPDRWDPAGRPAPEELDPTEEERP